MSINKTGESMPETVAEKEKLNVQIEELNSELESRKNDSVTITSESGLGGSLGKGETFEWKATGVDDLQQKKSLLEEQKAEIERQEQVERDRIEKERIENEERIKRERAENEEKISVLRKSIKEHEENISKIEKGKTSGISTVINRGEIVVDSVEVLHKKIVDTEKEIRILENKNRDLVEEKVVVAEVDPVATLENLIEKTPVIASGGQNEKVLFDDEDRDSDKRRVAKIALKKLEDCRIVYAQELEKYRSEQDEFKGVGGFFKKILRGKLSHPEPQSLVDARKNYDDTRTLYHNLIG